MSVHVGDLSVDQIQYMAESNIVDSVKYIAGTMLFINEFQVVKGTFYCKKMIRGKLVQTKLFRQAATFSGSAAWGIAIKEAFFQQRDP